MGKWTRRHDIPFIAFRVEWKGRSIVFTGDHMNISGKVDELEKMIRKNKLPSALFIL